MIWDSLKNIIGGKSSKPSKKEWLDKLVENLETKKSENTNLPFKIIEMKSTGFVVKVSGLYAFISFNHMPWKYSKINYWLSISPALIGKIFYCRVHNIEKDSLLSITIDGKIPQFRKTELLIGENYRGIIVEKVRKGIFIDIGYHFGWKCGSFIGFLHKSQFDAVQLFSSCSIGDEIEIFYQGINEKGMLVYSQTNEVVEWSNEIPQGLVGQIVLVRIVQNEDGKGIRLLVKGRYNGRMIYTFGSKQINKKIKNSLKVGEIVQCKVIGFDEKARTLNLKWAAELDEEIIEDIKNNISKKSIVNNLSDDTIQRLLSIREKIESSAC